nr:MAG TPA: hypothetical protein [Bacteriophage sp.]
MTEQEKRELVKLLWKYQMELLDADDENRSKDASERTYGVKAQFYHANCVASWLSTEVERTLLQ